MSRIHAISALAIVCLAFAGCSRMSQVSGRVLVDGKPYEETAEQIALTFTRTDGATSFSTSIKKDGSFKVYGPNSEGLMPGKYKVGYYSDIEGGRGKKTIKDLKPESTPLELDLNAGDSVSLTIDIVRGTMEKN